MATRARAKDDIVAINEREFGELRAQVNAIRQTLESMDRKLFGNGQPGIIHDLTKSIIDIRDTLIAGNVRSEANKAAIEAHIASDEKAHRSIGKNFIVSHWKSILFTLVAIFLLIHALIPSDLTLWDLIK
jgi:hypothetical protein